MLPALLLRPSPEEDLLGATGTEPFIRRNAITDAALKASRQIYADDGIGKEDLFYYVYGLLHSTEYKTRFEADLKKQLPHPFRGKFLGFQQGGP